MTLDVMVITLLPTDYHLLKVCVTCDSLVSGSGLFSVADVTVSSCLSSHTVVNRQTPQKLYCQWNAHCHNTF